MKSAHVVLSELESTVAPVVPSTESLRARYVAEMPRPMGAPAPGIRPVLPAPTLTAGSEIDIATVLNNDSLSMRLGPSAHQPSSRKFSDMSTCSTFVKDLLEPSVPGGVVALKVGCASLL